MGHLMDVSIELQYLFYPLHQMHNVCDHLSPFPLPLTYVVLDKTCVSLKAEFTS